MYHQTIIESTVMSGCSKYHEHAVTRWHALRGLRFMWHQCEQSVSDKKTLMCLCRIKWNSLVAASCLRWLLHVLKSLTFCTRNINVGLYTLQYMNGHHFRPGIMFDVFQTRTRRSGPNRTVPGWSCLLFERRHRVLHNSWCPWAVRVKTLIDWWWVVRWQ